MEITKQFRTETSHVVRNCTSRRCSYSIHGHSYLYEITLSSDSLDNAQMVMDFGLLKGAIKEYPKYVKHMKKHSERWIELPFNPSAEMMALWMLYAVNFILDNIIFHNGEDINLHCTSVTVHETTTGKATAYMSDLETLGHLVDFDNIAYSEEVVADWGEDLSNLFFEWKSIENPDVTQQIDLNN